MGGYSPRWVDQAVDHRPLDARYTAARLIVIDGIFMSDIIALKLVQDLLANKNKGLGANIKYKTNTH